MKEERLHETLLALDAEAHITRILLAELIAQSPEPELLLQRFRSAIDLMTAEAPQDIDPEQVVELRARAAQTELIVRRTLIASSAARPKTPQAR